MHDKHYSPSTVRSDSVWSCMWCVRQAIKEHGGQKVRPTCVLRSHHPQWTEHDVFQMIPLH
jgi:hypothetical protein